MKWRAVPAFLAVVVLTSCGSSRQLLSYDLQQGDRFTLTMSREQSRDRTFRGNRSVDTSTLRAVSHFTVTSVRDEGVELEIEYGERSLETDDPEREGPDLSPLEGNVARFLLSPTGELSDFSDFHQLPMIRMPGEWQGALHYQTELENLFPFLPDRPMAPGDSWTRRTTFKEPSSTGRVDVILDFRYTLDGPVENEPSSLLAISCDYTVSVTGQADAGDFFLDLDLEGEGTEDILFDAKRNMLVRSTGSMWVEGKAISEDGEVEVPIRNEYVTNIQVDF